MNQERLVYFLACDQSRQEDNNKSIYIGTYGATMIIEGPFPAFLPTLMLVGCFRLKKRKERVGVNITIPGLSGSQDFAKEIEQESPLGTVTLQFALSPCVLPQPGTVVAEYTFEDGEKVTRELQVVSRDEFKAARW